jgi:hypothetical protein
MISDVYCNNIDDDYDNDNDIVSIFKSSSNCISNRQVKLNARLTMISQIVITLEA